MKVNERERVHTQNRDLVTKNCGLQSLVDKLKKDVQALNRKNEQLSNENHQAKVNLQNIQSQQRVQMSQPRPVTAPQVASKPMRPPVETN